jgi:hypothetical protein
MFYVNFRENTKQNPIVDAQMIKESKHTVIENHEITKRRQ